MKSSSVSSRGELVVRLEQVAVAVAGEAELEIGLAVARVGSIAVAGCAYRQGPMRRRQRPQREALHADSTVLPCCSPTIEDQSLSNESPFLSQAPQLQFPPQGMAVTTVEEKTAGSLYFLAERLEARRLPPSIRQPQGRARGDSGRSLGIELRAGRGGTRTTNVPADRRRAAAPVDIDDFCDDFALLSPIVPERFPAYDETPKDRGDLSDDVEGTGCVF